jgi:predicted nuclease of predicted toxin-antitoxin system
MIIWIDAQLPPALANWINSNFDVEATPRILWLTCGNVTNRNLQKLLTATLAEALSQLEQGEVIVEISNNS